MDRRHRRIALLVATATFMDFLDGTIVSTAAPSMAISLGVNAGAIAITITAYLLTVAVLTPPSGWLAHRFGARRIFLIAIAVFTISSALCAASTSLPMLTAMRVLQGVGGALTVPVGRLVVLRGTAKSDLTRAIALLTWPALTAPLVAPLVGGLIVTHASWRWIFLINVPIGILTLVAALLVMPKEPEEPPGRLDWTGLLLTCIGLGSLVVAAALVAGRSIDWLLVGPLLAAGGIFIAWSVVHLLRVRNPLLDLRVFRFPTFRVSNASGSVYRMTIYAVPFLLPLMFQDGFGWSPTLAGTVVLFLFAGNLGIKPATTFLMNLMGFRPLLLTSIIGVSVTMVLIGFLTPDVPLWLMVVLMVASGAFRSVGFTGFNTIMFADVPKAELGQANTVSATMQQLASGFGVAVGAILLRAGQTVLDGAEQVLLPYRWSFVALAVITVLSGLETLRLDRSAAADLRKPIRGRSAGP